MAIANCKTALSIMIAFKSRPIAVAMSVMRSNGERFAFSCDEAALRSSTLLKERLAADYGGAQEFDDGTRGVARRYLSLLWQKFDFRDSHGTECVIHGEPALMEAGDGRGVAGGS